MGLIQRVFDEKGLATISLTTIKEISEQVKPSRAVFVEHPFGLTLGDVEDKETQRSILISMFEAAEQLKTPGSIRELPYRWKKDDLLERQLRKESH